MLCAQLVLQNAVAAGIAAVANPSPRLQFAWVGDKSWLTPELLQPQLSCTHQCIAAVAAAIPVRQPHTASFGRPLWPCTGSRFVRKECLAVLP